MIQVSIRYRPFCVCLCLLQATFLTSGLLHGQDPADESAVVTKSKSIKSYDVKDATEAEIKAKQERARLAKIDEELRARLENTVWNDVEISFGQPGYQWWLRTNKSKGAELKWKREWFLSERSQVPKVGSWTVKLGELLLIAPDGRVVARGKLDQHDEVKGEYYDPDRKQPFGSFHLIEESTRPYNIIPFRVIDPNAGK